MNIGSDARIKYNEAGPGGPAQFAAGAAGFEAQSFRGCGVFKAQPFEVSEETDSVQMLQRNTQVGEFYRMKAPETWDMSKKLPSNYLGARPTSLCSASTRNLCAPLQRFPRC